MAFISIPNSLTNGTTADASLVQADFDAIINGLSDTTKDLSINALTLAGALTANGNITLGNASGDTITFTGSLSSSIPIATNTTYNIGSATLGLGGAYIGGTGSFTTKIASAATASWTLTLPVTAGTAGYALKTDGSGNASWVARGNILHATTSQTTTYPITTSDDIILCSGSAFTATLPTAVGVTGKTYIIKKTDATAANVITIATTSSQTIGLASATSFTLQTIDDTIMVVSDGSNWQILSRHCTTPWASFTPTGAWSSNTTYTGYWRRVGDSIEVKVDLAITGTPTSATLTVNFLPNSWTIDTNKIPNTTAGLGNIVGHGTVKSAGNGYQALGRYTTSSSVTVVTLPDAAASTNRYNNVTQAAPGTFANGDEISLLFTCPITNWTN